MTDYYDHLQSGMQPVVKEILQQHFRFNTEEWSPLTVAAALHFYVHHKLPYEPRHKNGTRELRTVYETWNKGGNCEEKTIMLTSLYHCLNSIDTRIIVVRSNDGSGHLLVEIGAEISPRKIESKLTQFYQKITSQYKKPYSDSPVYYSTKGSRNWYLADPEMSKYIRDAVALSRQDFIHGTKSVWLWNSVDYYVYPDRGQVSSPQ
jgi:hypothetical protein